MNEEQEKLEKECSLCSEYYKQRYHCPKEQINSLLIKIACQVEHMRRREREGIY